MASTPSNMICGVRVSCDWDVKNLKAKKYIDVMVLKDYPVFNDFMWQGIEPFSDSGPSNSVSPVSELVGLPIHVRKIPPNPSLPGNDVSRVPDAEVTSRYENVEEATFLMKSMDPHAPED